MAATISANSAGGGGLVSSGDASGVLALQTAGVTALSIDASQKVTFANSLTSPTLVTPVIQGMASSVITSGTAVASTSGTSIDFTGIPSWAKRVTVMLNGVSTNGTSNIQVQIGAGSVDTTSTYIGAGGYGGSGATVFNTSAFIVLINVTAASTTNGAITLTFNSSNTWAQTGLLAASTTSAPTLSAGSKALSGALDRVRITTVNGTDTFDVGSINIMYE
jgi:hypothetical protein